MKEIGIYIHIPFCKSKCYYCDFVSFANKTDIIKQYIECLKIELIKRASDKYLVKTIFIGGGTPSSIDCKYIVDIINTVRDNYNIDEHAEITIEVNPKTVDKHKLGEYYKLGINRLSIGLQSANNEILKTIGRIHTFEDYIETIDIAKKVGFKNINTDIMIGLPNQTIYDVEDTLNKIISLNLTHISVYSLILEQGTKLEEMYKAKQVKPVDDEIERYMYWYAKRKLEDNGFIHYEISNFSKPGFSSKHNMDCWSQKEYLGFGVAAASYENKVRFVNTECIEKYIENIKKDELSKNVKIEEKQDEKTEMKEYIILGLRKIGGISYSKFREKFKKDPVSVFEDQVFHLLKEDLIVLEIDSMKLTKKGLDFANIAWEEFM